MNASYEQRKAGVCTLHSVALRSTAAPARKVGGGTGFARAASVGPLRHQSVSKVCFGSARWAVALGRQPNPSVNRTSNIRLGLLSAAGYLKR